MRPTALCMLLCSTLACGEKRVELPLDTGSESAAPDTLVAFPEDVLARARRMTLSPPEPDPTNRVSADPDAAHLGRWLFYDARLSDDGETSCSTCHDPSMGFTDALVTQPGVARHTPSIWDTAYSRWFYWDGRADSHWAQAAGPLENPREQNTSRLAVAHLVTSDPDLSEAYERLFGPLPDLSDGSRFPPQGRPGQPGDLQTLYWDGMTEADQEVVTEIFVNLLKSIAAYERTLLLGETRVDQFVAALETGDPDGLAALTESEQRGLRLFAGSANCHFCHAGGLTTNREFHNVGLASLDLDYGRFQGITTLLGDEFNGAGRWSDDPEAGGQRLDILVQSSEQLGQFKVPSLRGVSATAPYMRDGSRQTLADVIDFYDRADEVPSVGHREELIVPLGLSDTDKGDLEAFLLALDPVKPVDVDLLSPPESPVP